MAPAMPDTLPANPSDWCAIAPELATPWLAKAAASWWIAGGSAIDLYLGRTTRLHTDLDVGVLRRDAAELLRALTAWECFEAKEGALTALAPGAQPRGEVNSLWCRPSGQTQWMLELVLDDSDGDSWVYRRDARIRRELSGLLREDARGLSYLAPEVQLLYKAVATRDKDEADFRAVLPHLEAAARGWLLDSLRIAHPSHAWIAVLEDSKVS
jgi:hypothetical protein